MCLLQIGSAGYESLKVQNHTECECVYKNRQTQSRHVGSSRVSHTSPRTTTRRFRSQLCKCPSFFDVDMSDGSCGCVCRDGKTGCRQRYDGKEGFTISDQRFEIKEFFSLIRVILSFCFKDASRMRCAHSRIAITALTQPTVDDVRIETRKSGEASRDPKGIPNLLRWRKFSFR